MNRISYGLMVCMAGIGTCLLLSSHTREPASHMKSFRWVIGTWESPRKAGLMQETWKASNDSSFDGTSIMLMSNGESQLLEKMQLVYRTGAYYFSSSSEDQNDGKTISFRIDEYSDSHFLAVNLQHDFPKRILYRLSGPDSLFARIDAGPSAPDQKVDFHFSRKNK